MFLREECRDNLFQARKALPKRMMFGGGAARRKRTQVVGPQSHERGAQDHQHHRPRANRSVERRRAVRREALVEPTRQPHEAACGDQFGQVIERSLPPDILRLSRRREFRHVDTIGRDVVRGTAECHNGKDCDRDGEERRHVKRQSRDTEQHAAQQLGRNDPEFFRAVQLQKGLHRNLIVHGHMINDVQNAIWESEIPRSLNKTAETMFRTTNGKPIAKYKLGTQRRGE